MAAPEYSCHPRNEVGSVLKRLGAHTDPLGGLAGHLARQLASGTTCANTCQGFSDCTLKLGENMATYKKADSIELQGLHHICG